MDNIAKERNWIKKAKYFWMVFLSLCIILEIFFYFAGYRFTDNFKIGRSGDLVMTIPHQLTTIYIDNSEKLQTKKDNETVQIKLSPKTHSIIVSKEGYFPWTKTFSVPSNKKIYLSPIFVSQNASGQIITKNDPEYWKIRNLIYQNKPQTKINPLTSLNSKEKIWVEENSIMIYDGFLNKKVIKPETPINNISFYKDRVDAVIFSTENTIYVIETDPAGSQNFMPIYRGTKPYFAKTDPNFIYVLDGEILMQIVI